MSHSDVEVLLVHPHGALWIPLDEWIQIGPGKRSLLSPCSVRRSDTQEPLPLTRIPFRYRNNVLSRFFVSIRLLPSPWSESSQR